MPQAEIENIKVDEIERAYTFKPSTTNDEDRSVDVVIASESPVLTTYPHPSNPNKKVQIPEVLRMDGIVQPKTGKLPLLDSHRREKSEDLFGSVGDLRIEGDEYVGRAAFSSTVERIYTRVKEGHLTDTSVGAQVLESTFVPDGKTQVVNGKTYTGPVNVVTRWRPRELSVLPIGLDDRSKFRGLQENPQFQGGPIMDEELRSACIAAGMPADHTEELARGWLTENIKKLGEVKPPSQKEMTNLETGEPMITRSEASDLVERAVAKFLEGQEVKRGELRRRIESACERRGLGSEVALEISRKADTFEVAQDLITDEVARGAKQNRLSNFWAGPSERDKHVGAMRDGFLLRCLGNDYFTRSLKEDERTASEGHRDYRYRTLLDLARESVEMDGYSTRGLAAEQVANIALGFADNFGIRRSADYGYHTPGSFPQLLADALNKSLLRGYIEVPKTWMAVFRQASSVQDFKSVKRIRLGDVANIDQWSGIQPPKELGLADEWETYAVESYSNAVSLTYRTIVNDDLDALARVPMLLGASMARTVNAVAWAQITSNPTLQDGVSLFSTATGNRKKSNYTSSGSAPSVTSMAIGRNLLRQMVGVNDNEQNASQAILNIVPRYLVVPSSLETTAEQLTRSGADPANANPMVYNPASTLTPIVEPLLDANSTTAWYLFADTTQIDTVEVTFLAGQESPITRRDTDFETLAQKFIILQTFAAKAIDFRGMYKNNGQ